jgi:hypothetical protein
VETRTRSVAPYDAAGRRPAYGERMVRRNYAVLWCNGAGVVSGRLEPGVDNLQLIGRGHLLAIPFAELTDVAIARDSEDRIRGLPVLVLRRHDGGDVRIASLEGAAVLHELMEHIVQTGLTAAA